MAKRKSTISTHVNLLIAHRRWLGQVAEECGVTESAVVRAAVSLLQETEGIDEHEHYQMARLSAMLGLACGFGPMTAGLVTAGKMSQPAPAYYPYPPPAAYQQENPALEQEEYMALQRYNSSP